MTSVRSRGELQRTGKKGTVLGTGRLNIGYRYRGTAYHGLDYYHIIFHATG